VPMAIQCPAVTVSSAASTTLPYLDHSAQQCAVLCAMRRYGAGQRKFQTGTGTTMSL